MERFGVCCCAVFLCLFSICFSICNVSVLHCAECKVVQNVKYPGNWPTGTDGPLNITDPTNPIRLAPGSIIDRESIYIGYGCKLVIDQRLYPIKSGYITILGSKGDIIINGTIEYRELDHNITEGTECEWATLGYLGNEYKYKIKQSTGGDGGSGAARISMHKPSPGGKHAYGNGGGGGGGNCNCECDPNKTDRFEGKAGKDARDNMPGDGGPSVFCHVYDCVEAGVYPHRDCLSAPGGKGGKRGKHGGGVVIVSKGNISGRGVIDVSGSDGDLGKNAHPLPDWPGVGCVAAGAGGGGGGAGGSGGVVWICSPFELAKSVDYRSEGRVVAVNGIEVRVGGGYGARGGILSLGANWNNIDPGLTGQSNGHKGSDGSNGDVMTVLVPK